MDAVLWCARSLFPVPALQRAGQGFALLQRQPGVQGFGQHHQVAEYRLVGVSRVLAPRGGVPGTLVPPAGYPPAPRALLPGPSVPVRFHALAASLFSESGAVFNGIAVRRVETEFVLLPVVRVRPPESDPGIDRLRETFSAVEPVGRGDLLEPSRSLPPCRRGSPT